eukprot:1154344-Pelagomonas_calceolata.AAC.5
MMMKARCAEEAEVLSRVSGSAFPFARVLCAPVLSTGMHLHLVNLTWLLLARSCISALGKSFFDSYSTHTPSCAHNFRARSSGHKQPGRGWSRCMHVCNDDDAKEAQMEDCSKMSARSWSAACVKQVHIPAQCYLPQGHASKNHQSCCIAVYTRAATLLCTHPVGRASQTSHKPTSQTAWQKVTPKSKLQGPLMHRMPTWLGCPR